MNYIEVFNDVVSKKATCVAVVDQKGTRRTTYKQLDDLSDQVAYALSKNNINEGHVCVIKMSRKMEYVAAVLGVLKIGCAFVPVLPSYPENRIKQICKECNSSYLITDDFFNDLPNDYKKVNLPDDFDAINAPAYILFTSGTTSKPKGIVHSMKSFTNALMFQKDLMGGVKRNCSALAEFSFVASTTEIFSSFPAGACVHIIDEQTRMSITDYAAYIEKERIYSSFMTASHLKVFHSFKVLPKIIFLGGEQFPKIDDKYFKKTDFYNVYGQSETLGIMALHKVKPNETSIPLGKELDGLKMCVLNEDNVKAMPGERGEICVIAPYGVSYLNKKELSKKQFETLKDGNQLIHTGDIGYFDSNDELHYVSRKDFMVKINGMRVDIGGVESHIKSIPKVEQVVVKTVKNPSGNTCLAAYYSSKEGLSENNIKTALEKELPEYMIPQVYTKLSKFPLNNSNKIDRNALPEPNFKSITKYVAPKNKTERKLCEIFKRVLLCDKVGVTDNLQQLGGDSLSSMKIIVEIEKEFNIEIDPETIQTLATPKEISQLILKKDTTKTNQIEKPVNMFNILVAIAMFFLPFIHLMEEFITMGMVSESFNAFGEQLETRTTPVLFMLMIGYKLSYGEQKSSKLFKSGLEFLKMVLIFDFFRYGLTSIISYITTNDPGERMIFYAASDIYMFVALFYMTFAIIKLFKKSHIIAAILPIVSLAIFYLAANYIPCSNEYITGTFLGNFIFTGDNSFFPLLGWMYVPMIGYFCGLYIQKKQDEREKRIKNIGILSACTIVVCTLLFVTGIVNLRDGYLSSVPELLFHIALTGLAVTLIRPSSKNKVLQNLNHLGTYIMPYYLIHYVLVMFVVLAFTTFTSAGFMINPFVYAILGVAVYLIAILLAKTVGLKMMNIILNIGKQDNNKRKKAVFRRLLLPFGQKF